MLMAALVFSLMSALSKWMLLKFSLIQTTCIRSFFATVIVVIAIVIRREPILGHQRKILFVRGFAGFCGLLCFYYGLSNLQIADALILNKTDSIFIMVLASVILGEVITRQHLAVLAVAVIGIGIILKPALEISPLAGAIGLASGAFAGLAHTMIKMASATNSSPQVVLWFTGISFLLSFPLMLFDVPKPTPLEWLGFAGIGVAGALGQVLLTRAYRYATPTPIAISSYSIVLLSAIWGVVFFEEIPGINTFIGGALVIASCMFLPFLKAQMKARAVPAPITRPNTVPDPQQVKVLR